MSRNNKVNKDHYVQRGRLTPDEAARELAKMRQAGSQHTWQPTKKDRFPRLDPKDRAAGTETTEDNGSNEETSPQVETRVASRAMAKKSAPKPAPVKPKAAKATASKGKSTKTAKARTSSGKAKAGQTSKTAAKRTASKPKRKAVLARNVGGGGATPRSAAKRRKS